MEKSHVAPWQGHLDHLQRVCSYLRKYPDAVIWFRTGIPDYSHLDHIKFDWAYSLYGDLDEELPPNMPTLRGNPVCTTSLKMPISCTISLLGGTVQESFIWSTRLLWNGFQSTKRLLKLPPMVPVADCIVTEQIVDLKYTLQMVGVPLDGKAYMFGDDQSVITTQRWNVADMVADTPPFPPCIWHRICLFPL
jgi:hypothetical protein